MGFPENNLVKRLQRAIESSDRKMRAFQERQVDALRKFLGAHYGPTLGEVKAQPINCLHMAASVYIPNLVAADPQFRVRPRWNPALRSYASTFELVMEHRVRDMNFADMLRRVVFDSIFGVGLTKTGLASAGYVQVGGVRERATEPFSSRVSPGDYVVDPGARDREEIDFEGNRYQLPLADAREIFKNTDDLRVVNKLGGPDEAADLSAGTGLSDERLVEHTEVVDAFIPSEQLLITVPARRQGDKALNIVEWEGPEEGPYRMLGYTYATDNLMPMPPVAQWIDLHNLINALARKMQRQSEREKRVLAYEDRSAADAEKIAQSIDGDTVKVSYLEGLKEVGFGGTTPFQEQFLQWLIGVFSRVGGNVDLLGGLASTARTATEANLIDANAGARLKDMQRAVYKLVENIGKDLAYYLYTEPVLEQRVTKRVPPLYPGGEALEIISRFGPSSRLGEFMDYLVTIEPYSMQAMSPAQYAQTLMTWWNSVVLPTLPLAVQQGNTANIGAFVQQMAKEMGLGYVGHLYEGGPMAGSPRPDVGAAMEQGTPGIMSPRRTRTDTALDQAFSQAQQRAPRERAPQMAVPQPVGAGQEGV